MNIRIRFEKHSNMKLWEGASEDFGLWFLCNNNLPYLEMEGEGLTRVRTRNSLVYFSQSREAPRYENWNSVSYHYRVVELNETL